jgi:hypothetical protein
MTEYMQVLTRTSAPVNRPHCVDQSRLPACGVTGPAAACALIEGFE